MPIEDEALVARLTTAMLKQSSRAVQRLENLTAFQRDFLSIDLDAIEFAPIDVTLADGSGRVDKKLGALQAPVKRTQAYSRADRDLKGARPHPWTCTMRTLPPA